MSRLTNNFNRFNSTARIPRFVSTPTCAACQGSTIGPYGEQCRNCKGAGFVVRNGGFMMTANEARRRREKQ